MDSILDYLANFNTHERVVVGFTIFTTLLAFFLVKRFKNSIVGSLNESKATIEKKNEDLLAVLSESLSPRVVNCSREVDVTREATAMILGVIREKRALDAATPKKARDDEDDPLEEEESEFEPPFITFYGAANLGQSTMESLTEEEQQHYTAFNGALENAVDNGVRLRRHINFFSESELNQRTPEARRDYFDWLCSRFEYIHSNPKYEITHNPRVPQWGSSFSSLLTSRAVLEIKANGLTGIAIYHDRIAANIRESLKAARGLADQGRVRVYRSNDPKSVNQYFERIKLSSKVDMLKIQRIDAMGTHLLSYAEKYFPEIIE